MFSSSRLLRNQRVFRIGMRFNSELVGPIKHDTKTEKDRRREHIEKLMKYYPIELVNSILKAEREIDPVDYARARPQKRNQFGPIYKDDFATYDPVYDFARGEWTTFPKPRQPMPQHVVYSNLNEFKVQSKEEQDPFLRPGEEFKGTPYVTQPAKEGTTMGATEQTREGEIARIAGIEPYAVNNMFTEYIFMRFVSNQTRLGKKHSLNCLCVAGDQNGMMSLGYGRHPYDSLQVRQLARMNAIRGLRYVPRYEERTLYSPVRVKYHGVRLELFPAPLGYGLRVNHVVHGICRAAGLKDVSGRVFGSRNKMNVAKAAFLALTEHQVLPEDIARGRGKRITDVSERYFGF
ncbi:hypothetical protein CANCADRAFT_32228 [Tortispora caseinolytica NRRL Y-17796]|uniref:S5 DRBM domain-containing protein n=1 Tax=Tortispora caseinolytica NRRL Y-17796 TaxID=767744 RepID=A0A1E4TAG2_9ASCO|nr:hypothetical protein CANCADRAFT_32228 [Tortispora caseinolytica NRRL Y-17796]